MVGRGRTGRRTSVKLRAGQDPFVPRTRSRRAVPARRQCLRRAPITSIPVFVKGRCRNRPLLVVALRTMGNRSRYVVAWPDFRPLRRTPLRSETPRLPPTNISARSQPRSEDHRSEPPSARAKRSVPLHEDHALCRRHTTLREIPSAQQEGRTYRPWKPSSRRRIAS